AAAAERWRARAAKPNGGGLGGADTGSGPIGSGGQGPGGGGQLVGLEFIAYRQQVINTVKARWTNVIARPGLVVTIHFEIGPDGDVSGVRVEQSSGNAAYDASAVRAVQRATPLPPPPARYVKEFREFQIEFHSEEQGGQGAG
ncbi:MAG: cell envelope integrity protein TolA, partial [Deltaproteobacteria bacterium]